MSTKYDYNEPNNFGALYNPIYGLVQRYNTFTPSLSYDLDYIVLLGKRTGNCVSVDVDIYACDGSHKPTGASLATVQVLQAAIGTSEAETTFTLPSALSLSNGQEYAVVVSSAGPDSGNSYQWAYGFSNSSGYTGASTDGGSTWTGVVNSQGQWFQAWGTLSGPTPAHTPSPIDTATGQTTAGVNLSWQDDGPGDSYDIYFGPTGSMVLLESAWGSTSYSYTPYLNVGQEYSWRIDINDGEDVITGNVWTFTTETMEAPSTNLATIKRLIVASNNEIWYEDI